METTTALDGAQIRRARASGEPDGPESDRASPESEAARLKAAGNLAFTRGEWARAASLYSQALAIAPPGDDGLLEATLLSNRAESALRRGLYKAAFDDAERAIALAPTSEKAHARRAKAARAVGRYEDAQASLRRALELRPDDRAARAQLREVESLARLERAERGRRDARGRLGADDEKLLEAKRLVHELRRLRADALDEASAEHARAVEALRAALDALAPALEHLSSTPSGRIETVPHPLVQDYFRAVGALALLGELSEVEPCRGAAIRRLCTLCRRCPPNLDALLDVVPALQASTLSDAMDAAYHVLTLLPELFAAARDRAPRAFLASHLAPDALARLQRCAVSTPKQMGFRLETVRFTKAEWADAQRCAAEAIAACAEHDDARVETAAAVRAPRLLAMLRAPNRRVVAAAARALRAIATDARAREEAGAREALAELLSFAREAIGSAGEIVKFELKPRRGSHRPGPSGDAPTGEGLADGEDDVSSDDDDDAGRAPPDDDDDDGLRPPADEAAKKQEKRARRQRLAAAAKRARERPQDIVYYRVEDLEPARAGEAESALLLVAEDVEAAAAERADAPSAALERIAIDLARAPCWGLLVPLLHAPLQLALPALRVLAAASAVRALAPTISDMGAARPLLALDSPREHAVRTRVVEMYRDRDRGAAARERAAALVANCAEVASTQLAVNDDERRVLDTLVGLAREASGPRGGATLDSAARALDALFGFRPERSLLLDLRAFENVLVPAWRAADRASRARASLGGLLARLLEHEQFRQRARADFARRGRLDLWRELSRELQIDDVEENGGGALLVPGKPLGPTTAQLAGGVHDATPPPPPPPADSLMLDLLSSEAESPLLALD